MIASGWPARAAHLVARERHPQGFFRPAATAFLRGAWAGRCDRAVAPPLSQRSRRTSASRCAAGSQPAGCRACRATPWRTRRRRWSAATRSPICSPARGPTTRRTASPTCASSTRDQRRACRSASGARSATRSTLLHRGFIDELARAAEPGPVRFPAPDAAARLARSARAGRVLAEPGGSPAAPGFARGQRATPASAPRWPRWWRRALSTRAHPGVAGVVARSTAAWRSTRHRGGPDGERHRFGISARGPGSRWSTALVQQGNFDTFPALRMHECPAITVEVLDRREDPSGAGEPGCRRGAGHRQRAVRRHRGAAAPHALHGRGTSGGRARRSRPMTGPRIASATIGAVRRHRRHRGQRAGRSRRGPARFIVRRRARLRRCRRVFASPRCRNCHPAGTRRCRPTPATTPHEHHAA